MRLVALMTLVPALGVSFELQAQQPNRAARAAAVTETPVVDGRLDDAAWADAPVLSDLVQVEPVEGQPVSERTEVRVAYDEQALYVGAWLWDSNPSAIVEGEALRDAPLNNADAFVLLLDTYLDRQNGFVFGTTPAGIEFDGQVAGEAQSSGPFGGGGGGGGRGGGGGGGGSRQQRGTTGGFNLNWDGSWEVSTSRDERGWYVEMRIPFSTLRYGTAGLQTWGLNFERRIRRNNEQSVWSPIPRQFDLYRVSLAGTLDLEAPTTRTLTVSPYALGDAFKDYELEPSDTEFDQKFGGDAKVGLTPSLTLDLTVNTDFAQAEVDAQQVNLTRFSLFFPEKRAFFLENAGTFAVGAGQSAQIFFSRKIGLTAGREVPIRAGARLTGKVGDFQVGVLNIQTGDVSERDPLTEVRDLIAPNNNFGVLRAYREFGNRTQIGAIMVSRLNTDDTDDYNLTYGIDGRLGVGQTLTFNGWAGLTETSRLEGGDELSGFNQGEYAFAGSVEHVTRDWQNTLDYRQVGEVFNPEVGFLNRFDYRYLSVRTMRHIRTESVSWFREFRPHINWDTYWTLDGFRESYQVHIDNHFAFENGAFFQFPGLNLTSEGLEEEFEIREGLIIPRGTYNNVDWIFRGFTNQSAPLSMMAGWSLGGFYSGTRFGPNGRVSYRYRDLFQVSLNANYFDVRLDEGEFTTALVRLTGSYSFTPRLYLQANVQYNDDTEDLSTNLRLGWLDQAGTGLFIVYNDTNHTGTFERTGIPAGPLQRQLVIKYSRLFELTR